MSVSTDPKAMALLLRLEAEEIDEAVVRGVLVRGYPGGVYHVFDKGQRYALLIIRTQNRRGDPRVTVRTQTFSADTSGAEYVARAWDVASGLMAIIEGRREARLMS